MKTSIAFLLLSLSLSKFSYAQQIGTGYAAGLSNTDFNQPLKSGIYEINSFGINPDESHSWQHLFVLRHSNQTNNFQLQFSSSFNENDRIFFRKIANSSNPSWQELATRGANNFVGNQSIIGNLAIGNSTFFPNSKLEVTGGGITTSLTNINTTLTQKINTANPAISIGLGYLNSDMPFIQSFNNVSTTSNALNINPFGGNVGIGTSNPTSKLTVAGNINSREVKVTVDAGADFVFENDYNLPSLDSVDKYIKENKHLPEIASAEEMKKDGINLSEMNVKLLQKIEELTLHLIEKDKQLNFLLNENKMTKRDFDEFRKLLLDRLETLEKKTK